MKKIALGLLAAMVASPALADPMSPGEYVITAAASDLYERTSSQVVLETSQNARVRQFAQMMLAHHTQSTADVSAAARQSSITPPPPQLTPLQTELVAQLRAERGSARDLAYIAQQKQSHNAALAVQKAYATEGTAPALRGAAQKIVPVVEMHIAELKTM